MTEKLAGYLLLLSLFLVAWATCFKVSRATLYVNGQEYRHVGFMLQEDNGANIYIPVYRRTN